MRGREEPEEGAHAESFVAEVLAGLRDGGGSAEEIVMGALRAIALFAAEHGVSTTLPAPGESFEVGEVLQGPDAIRSLCDAKPTETALGACVRVVRENAVQKEQLRLAKEAIQYALTRAQNDPDFGYHMAGSARMRRRCGRGAPTRSTTAAAPACWSFASSLISSTDLVCPGAAFFRACRTSPSIPPRNTFFVSPR
jgi:hypothetical protein